MPSLKRFIVHLLYRGYCGKTNKTRIIILLIPSCDSIVILQRKTTIGSVWVYSTIFPTDIPIHNIPLLPTCLLQASQSFVEFNSLSLHPFTISTVHLPFRCSCYITFRVPGILRQHLTLSTNIITIQHNNDAHSRCELPTCLLFSSSSVHAVSFTTEEKRNDFYHRKHCTV